MSEPVGSWDMKLAMDYGHFSLSGSLVEEDEFADEFADDAEARIQTLNAALVGDHIARTGNLVTVVSPHQNNFAMEVRFELWTREPPIDLDQWQEVFETSLSIDERGLLYESPTMDVETIGLEPGHYGLRLSGAGFSGRGWPGSTTPGDYWRWQFWPASAELPTRRRKAWAEPAP